MNEISTLITTIGFPIVACLGSFYFIYEMNKEERKENINREERLYLQLQKYADTMDKFNNTLLSMDKRLEYLENKIGGFSSE